MSNNELADELVDELDLDLLAQLWTEPEVEGEPAGIIATQRVSGVLSLQQKRLWLLQQIDPQSNAYDVLRAYHAPVTLDLTRLQSALDALVECHEIFRTFYQFDGTATQVIASACKVPLTIINIDSVLDSQSLFEQAAVKSWCDVPFNLSQVPLLRAAWVNVPQGGYLLLRNHHIVSDAWSKTLILRDLLSAYQGKALVKSSCRYLDYATWQSEYLSKDSTNETLTYWRDYIKEQPQPVTLPSKESTATLSSFPIMRSHQLSEFQSRQVTDFCQRHGSTSAAVFMTLLQATLSRFSSTQDFLIGSPTAARNRPELAEVVGCFMNTQLYKNEVREGVTFIDAVNQNQRHTLRLINEDQVPFEWLAEQLEWPVLADRHPYFQVLFNYLQSDTIPSNDMTVALRPINVENQVAKFELSLDVSVQNGVIELYFEADGAMYHATLLEQLLACYMTLLDTLVSKPATAINDVAVYQPDLTPSWLRQPNEASTVVELIERQEISLDAVALQDDSGGKLNYETLLRLSSNFANFLIEQGMQPEDRVAVVVLRRVDMVVALLGCMQAGVVYVPVDPNMPHQRQQLIFASSGVRAIITNLEEAFNPNGLPVWSIAKVNRTQYQDHKASRQVCAQQLAYVLYTSGSTGQPKGVAITHGNLVNFILAMKSQFPLTQDSKWLALTALGFDISGLELYLPLICGAQVRIADSVFSLKECDLEGISHIQATPAGWQGLLAKALLAHPVVGLCGGEALPPALAQALKAKQVALYNMYGPTETTVWSSCHPVNDSIHLGFPIRNTQLYVLDSYLNVCPPGVAGELYIGGEGVARGYMEQPGLTAQRFVADPFSCAGERLYRTGDLVERNEHNELRFLGRADHQVKIRGHRIETGETESQLLRLDGVSQAVVVAHGDDNDKRLVAYVCTQTLNRDQIKAAVSDFLPNYMVPEQIILLETLPLNHSGKVDRKALPKPAQERRRGTQPQGHLELALARVWQQVLQVNQIYREDNFFALGGNSIHALRMVHQWQKLARPEPLFAQAIWQADSLRDLAQQIACSKHANISDILPGSASSKSYRDLLICLHDGRGFTMSYRPLAMAMPEHIRCVGITPDLTLSQQDDFSTLAHRYAHQLGDLRQYNNVYVLGWSLGGALALQLIDALKERDIPINSALLIDSWDPFEPINTQPESWRDYISTRLSESIAAPSFEVEFYQAVDLFCWSEGSSAAERANDITRFVSEHLGVLEESIAAMPITEIVQTLEQTYLLRCASRHELSYRKVKKVDYYIMWSNERNLGQAERFAQNLDIQQVEYVDADHMQIISHPSVIETVQKVIKSK